jgi:hypothetical protein
LGLLRVRRKEMLGDRDRTGRHETAMERALRWQAGLHGSENWLLLGSYGGKYLRSGIPKSLDQR